MNLPLPSPHLRDQLALLQGVSKGTYYLFSLLPAATGAPIKPCLNLASSQFLLIGEGHEPSLADMPTNPKLQVCYEPVLMDHP